MIVSLVGIVVCIALGIGYQRVRGVQAAAQARALIGRLVLWFLLPALAFRTLWSLPENASYWKIPLVATITCLVCLALAWIVFRSRESKPTVGALLYASGWSNATYLGIPILTAVIGSHATRYAVLYDILALTPLLFTVGSVIGIVYGDKGHRQRRTETTRAILPLPPLVAAVAGIIANRLHVNLPTSVVDALSVASSLVAPLMLVSIGMALRPPRMATMRRIAPAVGITLVVAPVVAWIVGHRLVGLDAESLLAVTLEAGMPSMMLPMVFAERYGLDSQTLAEAIVVSTVASAFTVPVIAILVATP